MIPYDLSSEGWTRREAAHLLWRAQFGASEAEIIRATDEGLEKSLERLVANQKKEAAFEETAGLLRQTAIDTGNIDQLKTWWLYRMTAGANPLQERMSLFWHNHFATSNAKVRSARLMAEQNDLIRTHAMGNFRALLKGMARDVAMLVWLDGNANRKRSPNENFAREVMELFALGVGNYGEHDIKEAARAFTGWHVRGERFWFNRLQHDAGPKEIFGKVGNFDGADVIELCLAHEACPRFLATKLLREFVIPDPSAEAIGEVADSIRRNDFAMAPVLRELLGSRLFFSPESRHRLIKSPVHFVLGSYRALEVQPNLKASAQLIANLGQDLFLPPTVKGWEGGRLWITSATLLLRANFAARLAGGDSYGKVTVKQSDLDHLAELLLARDAELAPVRAYRQAAEGKSDEALRGTLHLLMTMPEYQLT